MTLASLADVLQPALKGGYAVGGLVTLGWEDMRAFVRAAEEENCAVILQAGPGCRSHTPLPILGKMFRYLAEQASVPVVAHLDHGYTYDECSEALDSGFTSIMFDGSRTNLRTNIAATLKIAEMAHKAGISCEGEIGFVGYSNGEQSSGTNPKEAAIFAAETGVDAMAISVGNVHLQEKKEGGLDEDRIAAIQKLTAVPLVIHGGSGVPVKQRSNLAKNTNICKYNIGTELRMAFGDALREAVSSDLGRFDRVAILKETHDPMVVAARRVLTAFERMKMLNIGLLGAGRIGQVHGATLAQIVNARTVAVSDFIPAAAEALASKLDAKVMSTEEIIADGSIDAVVIGTPYYNTL